MEKDWGKQFLMDIRLLYYFPPMFSNRECIFWASDVWECVSAHVYLRTSIMLLIICAVLGDLVYNHISGWISEFDKGVEAQSHSWIQNITYEGRWKQIGGILSAALKKVCERERVQDKATWSAWMVVFGLYTRSMECRHPFHPSVRAKVNLHWECIKFALKIYNFIINHLYLSHA